MIISSETLFANGIVIICSAGPLLLLAKTFWKHVLREQHCVEQRRKQESVQSGAGGMLGKSCTFNQKKYFSTMTITMLLLSQRGKSISPSFPPGCTHTHKSM